MQVKRITVFLALAMLTVTLFHPQAALAEKFKLRLQCAYPQNANVGQTTEFFAERLKELTKGNVTTKIFWPDQLVKTNEAFDSLSKGMIDAYSGSMLYFSGYVPEVNCEWIPFGWADAKEALDVYQNHGWLDLMREATLKHGVHYVAPLSVASMGLITKFPVNSIDDMKGRTIRAVGMEAKIITLLGASAVATSGAEQYMALQRGTVEGTDYPFYTIGNYKFYEVCSHIIRPALHSPGIVEILINDKVYKSMPEEYRKAVDQAGWEAFVRSVELSPKWDEDAYQISREKDVTIIDLKPEVVDEFRKASLPLWKEISDSSETSKKLVDNLKNYMTKKGVKIE
jgi:TRAP-type C4-dicarboxylate transport system substrate-binding protein